MTHPALSPVETVQKYMSRVLQPMRIAKLQQESEQILIRADRDPG